MLSYRLRPSQLLWCPISLHPSPEQCWFSHRPRPRPRPRLRGAFGNHGPQQNLPNPCRQVIINHLSNKALLLGIKP